MPADGMGAAIKSNQERLRHVPPTARARQNYTFPRTRRQCDAPFLVHPITILGRPLWSGCNPPVAINYRHHDVSFGSRLCENAAARDSDRMNIFPNRILV